MRLLSTIYGACSISAGLFWAAFVSDAVAGPAAATNLVATSTSSSVGRTVPKREAVLPPVGTPISPRFFGQNAWLPIQIGARAPYGGDLEELLCGASYASGGQLQGGACVPGGEVQASGVQLMRYGGKGVDRYFDANASPAQYLTMVHNMRANGIHPLLQVPVGDVRLITNRADREAIARRAAGLVRYINIRHRKNVRHWSIGNEPNQLSDPNDLNSSFTTHQIARYFKEISQAMKEVDPTIIVTGPDLSFYDPQIMESLTDCPLNGSTSGPFGPDDITGRLPFQPREGGPLYYVDILNFHFYPFDGLDTRNTPDTSDDGYTRQEVIAKLADPDGFEDKITQLKVRVDACNLAHSRMDSPLKMAVTEMNINYRNPLLPVDEYAGVGATSFLAGQFWAEAMSIGMKNALEGITFWSVKEGTSSGETNFGYIKHEDGRKLSTYYHFQMMANNFRGVYAPGTDSENNADVPEVKAFGSKAENKIVVMILNQTTSTDYDYTVRLDTGTVLGAGPLKINIEPDAGVVGEYNSSEPLLKESTVMLVFDGSGVIQKRYVYSLEDARNDRDPREDTCPC